jgi:hypothetical protein
MKPLKYPLKFINLLRRLLQFEIVSGPLTYNQDGLATRHNADFMYDKHFQLAYNAGKRTGSWGREEIHWRAYIACWAAEKAVALDGDFVECGVNRGGLAITIMEFVNFKSLSKKFFLFDTFNGLVENLLTDEERALGCKGGGYEECYNEVKTIFSSFSNVVLIRGPVPDTLERVNIQKVSYLSIDMNCVTPEIAAVQFFWDKIVSGGIVLLDDYGWHGHIEQKKAFDIFSEKNGVRVLPLPTGQGIILKP